MKFDERLNVRIPAEKRLKLERLGYGNLSAAMRRLIDALPDTLPEPQPTANKNTDATRQGNCVGVSTT